MESSVFYLNRLFGIFYEDHFFVNRHRLLAEQAERSLEEQTLALDRKEIELRNAEDKLATLERHVDTLSVTSKGDRDEITTLRATIAALDREKDVLQAAVDEKTEKVAQLEEALYSKDRNTNELKLNIGELESTVK